MIIICKSCKTRYNLDEGLLKPTGSKVRCSSCRYIFLAYPHRGKMKPNLSNPELNLREKIESWTITGRKGSHSAVTKNSLEPTKAKKSFVVTSIESAKSVPTVNIAKDKSNDLPNSHDLIDVNDITTEGQGRSEIIDEFGCDEAGNLQPIVNLVMTDYEDLPQLSDLEKITKFDNAAVSEKNIESGQAFCAKRQGKIININSLKKKPKTKIWIPAVTSALIVMILILGCYRKISQSGNPYFVDLAEPSMTLSEKDMNHFGSSVKVIDGQAESHYKMALYFQRRKKHKLAIEELKRAIQHNPLFAKAYNAMGVSYDNLGSYSQAIGCYQSALKLDPKSDYVYNNLGYCYLLKNELDAAIKVFQKAIELNDNNKRYRNNLGLAYVMKEQYAKAYEQFKIIEDDTGAIKKMARLFDQLGKEPDQYFAKDSNLEDGSKKTSGREKPVVVRRKIEADSEKEDSQFLSSDKKAYLNPDNGKVPLDETQSGTMDSRGTLAKHPEITEPKKIRDPENNEKESHRELKTESNQPDKPASCEFCEEDTAESNRQAAGINSEQTIAMENQKSAAEKKTEIYNVDESSASSDAAYDLSAAKLVSEPASGKNLPTGSVEFNQSANESSNGTQNDDAPKVIKIEDSYYPNAEGAASATPVEPAEAKKALIETNQKVLKENHVSAHAKTASFVKSSGKKMDRKIRRKIQSQQDEALSLAVKEQHVNENFKPEETIVEVEIEVANGNGIKGAAARFGSYLNSKGFKVAKITNANSFDHAITKIFYCNGDINSQ